MTAFVMIPYRDSFQRIYEAAIRPAIEGCGLKSVLAKDEWSPGPIDAQIVGLIKASQVCIADLTGANPNVMYEVALAHSLGKPVILITQGAADSIPFDIRHHRVITYSTPEKEEEGKKEIELLSKKLTESLLATLEFKESPIQLLRQMLVPASLGAQEGPYVVAASPLSYREAFRVGGGWIERPVGTYSDHVGIRGLMQAFGLIYGLDRLPHLLNPDDCDDKVLDKPMHLYCIASPKANRWTGKMMERFFENRNPKWEFKPDPESSDLRNPRVLVRVSGKPYEPVNVPTDKRLKWDFGLVIRGPHPLDPSYMLLALAGRSSLGTEAACLAATDPECLQKLIKRLNDKRVSLDDHKQGFCAVVSISSKEQKSNRGADPATFEVETLSVYKTP
jgi:hypothetical protein